MRDLFIDIVCLQETKLGHQPFNAGLNYKIFNSPPIINIYPMGGTAIIIKSTIHSDTIALKTSLQAIAIRIMSPKIVTICSIYIPPDIHVEYREIRNLIDQLPTPFLLLGDFNAHNPMWGDQGLDTKGSIMEKIIDHDNISLLNDGTPTYHNIYHNSYSAIDMSICSSSILMDYTWQVQQDLNGSDHYPIILRDLKNTPSISNRKWNLKKANWNEFRRSLNFNKSINDFTSSLEAYNFFQLNIMKSAELHIPQTGGMPRRPVVPWWNEECKKLRNNTRCQYRRFKNSGSAIDKIIYKKAMARQRKYFKQAKRDSWREYINTINSSTEIQTIWKKIQKLKGKFVPPPLPTLKINNKIITSPAVVANEFGKNLTNIASNYHKIQQKCPQFNNSIVSRSNALSSPITIKELESALKLSKPSAPGDDNIIYEMMKELNPSGKVFLLNMFNRIFESGVLPKSWKTAIIIPILKKQKEPTNIKNYRPIALTSCVCKLMEKIINTRLTWYLEINNILSPDQYGLRKQRSTTDSLFRLTNEIQKGFTTNMQTIAVFFDIEKAYDTVDHQMLLNNIKNIGIQGKMLLFLEDFLKERILKVRIGNVHSSSFVVKTGIPQGSVLSVTLFAIAINNITNIIPKPIKISLFVDDIVIFNSGYDAVSVTTKLQNTIDKITKWAVINGFTFSSTKTIAMRFTRRREREIIPTLKLEGLPLEYGEKVKFLGMTLDSKLTWAPHIAELVKTSRKSLDILKVLSNIDWGSDQELLLRIYSSICRSRIDYASTIYSSASKTLLRKLDVIHNAGIRISTGAFRTSPIESMYVDAGEIPLDIRREKMAIKYLYKLKASINNPTTLILKEDKLSKYRGTRTSKPFKVRLQESCSNLSLLNQNVEKVGFSDIPPWLIPRINICKKIGNKKLDSEEVLRGNQMEHDSIHSNAFKIYTDGSKSKEGVGYAANFPESIGQGKLPKYASIFTAEITPIYESLKLISNIDHDHFVIYSDSANVINAIYQYNSFHPLIQLVQKWLFINYTQKKKIYFCWVPGHAGIKG
ncbi:MAG: reverse transcriptase domain-containing protein, partial [Brevinema sp.]